MTTRLITTNGRNMKILPKTNIRLEFLRVRSHRNRDNPYYDKLTILKGSFQSLDFLMLQWPVTPEVQFLSLQQHSLLPRLLYVPMSAPMMTSTNTTPTTIVAISIDYSICWIYLNIPKIKKIKIVCPKLWGIGSP